MKCRWNENENTAKTDDEELYHNVVLYGHCTDNPRPMIATTWPPLISLFFVIQYPLPELVVLHSDANYMRDLKQMEKYILEVKHFTFHMYYSWLTDFSTPAINEKQDFLHRK